MKQIYLDYAAATPMDPEVFEAMSPYFTDKFYNPSAVYLAAHGVSKDLADARSTVALCIGARPVEITFTAGGTEANNLAVSGVLRSFPGSKIVFSAIEHDSVRQVARAYLHAEVEVTNQGVIDLEALARSIDDTTVLVSIMLANNEIGTIQPVRDVVKLVEKIRNARKQEGNTLPLYIHTDAAQAANYLDIHVSRIGIDLMTLNGGKIYGPKASGALYVRSGVRLQPLIYGGGQEHGLRSGTENVAGTIGFAAALKKTQAIQKEESSRLQELQRYFITHLQEVLPSTVINGSLIKRLPNNIHITLPGQDNERLLFALDEYNILAAAGSACSASRSHEEEPSHVLRALGLSDEMAHSSLRFTLGRCTAQQDVTAAIAALSRLLA